MCRFAKNSHPKFNTGGCFLLFYALAAKYIRLVLMSGILMDNTRVEPEAVVTYSEPW